MIAPLPFADKVPICPRCGSTAVQRDHMPADAWFCPTPWLHTNRHRTQQALAPERIDPPQTITRVVIPSASDEPYRIDTMTADGVSLLGTVWRRLKPGRRPPESEEFWNMEVLMAATEPCPAPEPPQTITKPASGYSDSEGSPIPGTITMTPIPSTPFDTKRAPCVLVPVFPSTPLEPDPEELRARAEPPISPAHAEYLARRDELRAGTVDPPISWDRAQEARAQAELMTKHPEAKTLSDALKAEGLIHCPACIAPEPWDDDLHTWCDCGPEDELCSVASCKHKAHEPSQCLWRPLQLPEEPTPPAVKIPRLLLWMAGQSPLIEDACPSCGRIDARHGTAWTYRPGHEGLVARMTCHPLHESRSWDHEICHRIWDVTIPEAQVQAVKR